MPPSRGACAGSATSVAAKPCSGRTAWAAASGTRRRKTSAGPNNTAPTGPAHSIGDDRMHKLLQEGHAVGNGGVIKDEGNNPTPPGRRPSGGVRGGNDRARRTPTLRPPWAPPPAWASGRG